MATAPLDSADRPPGGWRQRLVGPRSAWRQASAAQLFAASFLGLIGLGTVGFRVLPGLYTGEPFTWLDALFTTTSAVCVTGLIVEDTATFLTGWGQGYVLLLIQAGGLGILTFTTLILNTLGRRLSLRHASIMTETASFAPHVDPRRLTRDVFLFTFGVEAVGAAALWLFWLDELGPTGALWPAIFHAVSAFCNAGFSTYTDSLVGWADAPGVLGVVMGLIVIGGIGFVVLEELTLLVRRREHGRRTRLSLHARVVLATTAVLIVGGWGLFTLFEWNATFAAMSVPTKLLNGLFLSVTTRTAGFNTIHYGEAAADTNFLTILLMSVGGSPGSTAGGLKTTTAALIGLAAWSRLRGRPTVTLWFRTIPDEAVRRAVTLFVIAFGIVTTAIFVLTTTDLAWADGIPLGEGQGPFLALMFEAASAFNTVGLSMGVTGTLSAPGRLTMIVLMFIGRIGPLTFAAALSRPERPAWIRYASEDVGVG